MKAGTEKRAIKYARALLEALTPADYRRALGELAAVQHAIDADAQAKKSFLDTLQNPSIPLAGKLSLIDAVVPMGTTSQVRNVLVLLTERRLVGLLPQVREHAERLVNEYERLSHLHVISAKPLSVPEQEQFTRDMKQQLGQLGALVQLSFASDATLLGGMQIRCGDKVLDSSLAGAVGRIFEELQRAA